MDEGQDKLRRELAAFIVRQSWETMNGTYTEASILDALEMARKFHGLQLLRGGVRLSGEGRGSGGGFRAGELGLKRKTGNACGTPPGVDQASHADSASSSSGSRGRAAP